MDLQNVKKRKERFNSAGTVTSRNFEASRNSLTNTNTNAFQHSHPRCLPSRDCIHKKRKKRKEEMKKQNKRKKRGQLTLTGFLSFPVGI
jgi:hypothetical protein